MKRLYVLSPSDRFNYGDMLFPYIIKHYFKDSVDEIINCATSSSDLSEKGGIPTYNYEKIFNAPKENGVDNYLMIAGGECLFSPWPVILSYVFEDVNRRMKVFSSFPRVRGITRFTNLYMDSYVRHKYKILSMYPFTIGLDEIPNFKGVLYNSVGGVGLEYNKRVLQSEKCKKILKSASYLSVRDSKTSRALKEMGVNNIVCPDSAILMSEVFSGDFLLRSISKDVSSINPHSYVFFQINSISSTGNEEFYGEMLNRIFLKHRKKFILCPIGTAYGHEDDISLLKISKHMREETYKLISSPTIWDIMYLIKNSCVYVGTSLHGAITASSFSVPIVTHGKKKVEQYVTEWGGLFSYPQKLEEDIIKQLTNPVVSPSSEQKQLSISSINRMLDIIKK